MLHPASDRPFHTRRGIGPARNPVERVSVLFVRVLGLPYSLDHATDDRVRPSGRWSSRVNSLVTCWSRRWKLPPKVVGLWGSSRLRLSQRQTPPSPALLVLRRTSGSCRAQRLPLPRLRLSRASGSPSEPAITRSPPAKACRSRCNGSACSAQPSDAHAGLDGLEKCTRACRQPVDCAPKVTVILQRAYPSTSRISPLPASPCPTLHRQLTFEFDTFDHPPSRQPLSSLQAGRRVTQSQRDSWPLKGMRNLLSLTISQP